MLHILEGLDPQEYDIYVASKPGGAMVDEVLKRGYHYLPIPLFRHAISWLDFIVFFQLVIVFRKYRFDIVHTHSSKPGLLGRIAAKLAGVPLIIHTGHGAPFFTGQPHLTYTFYKTMERIGALFCDKLVFVNHTHRLYYINQHMIPIHKAVTIYNAINPELLQQIESAVLKKKDRNDIVTIGSIFRFSRQKNIIMTISVAIKVCKKRNDVQFVFVGDGEYFELCRLMVDSNQLQDRIILPGWQSNTAGWLAGFDAFMLYSLYEGLPMCIIEAMHATLPIIGSDIPSIAELVDNTNGWLIPSEQPLQLESELHKIINAKDSYRQKGLNGKNKARNICSYESFIHGYKSLYTGD